MLNNHATTNLNLNSDVPLQSMKNDNSIDNISNHVDFDDTNDKSSDKNNNDNNNNGNGINNTSEHNDIDNEKTQHDSVGIVSKINVRTKISRFRIH